MPSYGRSSMTSTCVITKTKTGEYRESLKAGNGEVLMMSESYIHKSSTLRLIQSVLTMIPTAEIRDMTDD